MPQDLATWALAALVGLAIVVALFMPFFVDRNARRRAQRDAQIADAPLLELEAAHDPDSLWVRFGVRPVTSAPALDVRIRIQAEEDDGERPLPLEWARTVTWAIVGPATEALLSADVTRLVKDSRPSGGSVTFVHPWASVTLTCRGRLGARVVQVWGWSPGDAPEARTGEPGYGERFYLRRVEIHPTHGDPVVIEGTRVLPEARRGKPAKRNPEPEAPPDPDHVPPSPAPELEPGPELEPASEPALEPPSESSEAPA